MMMEKKRKDDAKWYNNSSSRHWNLNMIPSVSRPSSRRSSSLQSSLPESDWVSLAGARSLSSGASNVFESPKSTSYYARRRKSRGDIEEILSKHQVSRPRSVSLVKYDPLPAINSEATKPQTLSKTLPSAAEERIMDIASDLYINKENLFDDPQISPIEEQHEESEDIFQESHKIAEVIMASSEESKLEGELKEEEESILEQKSEPPKLVRSRTFDVIETNLTNLPVIDDHSVNSQSEDIQVELETTSLNNTDKDDSEETKTKFEVCVSVDGVALNIFLSQCEENVSLSSLSLVTHPGTPDSGFAMGSGDRDHNFEGSIKKESYCSDSEATQNSLTAIEQPIENKILVKLPNNKDSNLTFSLDATLKDFLSALETLEWEEHCIRVVDDVDAKLLSEPLRKFPFKSVSQVNLVPCT